MKTFKSVDSIVRRADERRVREAMDATRVKTLSVAELAVSLKKQAESKLKWLDSFSSGPKKRPEHEISSRRHELAVLVQAHDHLIRGSANVAGPPK